MKRDDFTYDDSYDGSGPLDVASRILNSPRKLAEALEADTFDVGSYICGTLAAADAKPIKVHGEWRTVAEALALAACCLPAEQAEVIRRDCAVAIQWFLTRQVEHEMERGRHPEAME